MIDLGSMNLMEVKSIEETVIILADQESGEEAELNLLIKENIDGVQGLTVKVFVDRDIEGKLQASLKRPDIVMGEIKHCRVVDITDLGAFLDWGLSHDLFLPHKNHRDEISMGDKPLVMLTVNPKGRISATMEIYKQMQIGAPQQKGELAKGTIYSYSEELESYFIAIDNKYHGMIPKNETIGEDLKLGEEKTVRIKRVRADGKLDCTPKKKAYQNMDDDAKKVMMLLDKEGGKISLHDKSKPDEINAALSMSKASFKRAIGRLYKNGLINLEKDGISKLGK
jgi:hypothetical protein